MTGPRRPLRVRPAVSERPLSERHVTKLQLKGAARLRRDMAEESMAIQSKGTRVRQTEWGGRQTGPYRRRKRAVVIGTLPTSGQVLSDPAVDVAYDIRRALRVRSEGYRTGACRRIDPVTGQVIGLIDPVTRIETVVNPAEPEAPGA